MMAFERLEPFGTLHEEFMTGQLCALIANVNRDPKKGSPFANHDFMPALADALGKKDGSEPLLLDDPDAHGQLLKKMLFGERRND